MEVFDKGDLKRLTIVTRNIAGALTDPTALAVRVLDPDWTLTTKSWPADVEVVRDSLGTFHYDLTFTKAEKWIVALVATGAVVETEKPEFWARRVEP